MVPTRVPDHVEKGLALTLSQYRERPIFLAWLASYLRQVQDLEDATYDTIVSRFLDRAKNAQLDLIGKIVGESRKGRGDDLYRVFVGARIRINRSFGRYRDVLEVYNIICSAPKLLLEIAPARLRLELLDVPSIDPVLILEMLRDTKAGGVGLSMVSPTTEPSKQFRACSVGDTSVHDWGCGDANSPASFGLVSDAVTMRS